MGKRDTLTLNVTISFDLADALRKLIHTDDHILFANNMAQISREHVETQLKNVKNDTIRNHPVFSSMAENHIAHMFLHSPCSVSPYHITITEHEHENLRHHIEPLLSVHRHEINYKNQFENFLAFLAPHVVDVDHHDKVIGTIVEDVEHLNVKLLIYRHKTKTIDIKSQKME